MFAGKCSVGLAGLFTLFGASLVSGEVAIEWVTVGDPGNPAGYGQAGSVDYVYRISRYEITNSQYAEFLNAVAATGDHHGLFMAFATPDQRQGIERIGPSGDYSYVVKPGWENKPVNYVSWFSALRFINWLHNGQLSGAQDVMTTENGAYDLSLDIHDIERQPGAEVYLPNLDEWYKAGCYEPGASEDGYWDYATRSDDVPKVAHADSNGNIDGYFLDGNSGPWVPGGENIANYKRGADWNGVDGNFTTVGSAGPLSESYYGAADLCGNAAEYIEYVAPSWPGIRVVFWSYKTESAWYYFGLGQPTNRSRDSGFRVASPAPDVIPPDVGCTVRPDSLWPPNHAMVEVYVSIFATDEGTPAPEDLFGRLAVLASSNEPDSGQGDGHAEGDVNFEDGFTEPVDVTPMFSLTENGFFEGTISLRAERGHEASDRIYSIEAFVRDAAGNIGCCSCEVIVPHDKGQGEKAKMKWQANHPTEGSDGRDKGHQDIQD